ncbi:hypothetical protein CYMTET_54736 [Cymbomonas tetramitiformis]|uniref:tRNA (adenine(58)-N(1))-methyltransferase n=1 Tax=Cymbomonas tetramitiformis TaxID=36881 RepID=A0AAE0BG56_9CHLO|nr:hypothetical protein CYMTET_54736 [Cymbomonas tetramitiformis]
MLRTTLCEQQQSPLTVKDGDLVIVYESHDRMKPVYVTAGKIYGSKFGNFSHDDWIGKSFGSKVTGKGRKGWVHLLAPTPELWTLSLTHRTQILYIADISLVVSYLQLRPGCVVLESGTGSGSLTTSFIRAVAPEGHVFTFEFHAGRAQTAREEFERNKLSKYVTVTTRDIEGQGFPEALAGKADGVFLDLPGPWKVVPSVAKSLRPDGVFCSFSPCVEQVQKTCEAMAANGFVDIETIEILLREYELDRVDRAPLKRISADLKEEDAPPNAAGIAGGKRTREEAGLDEPAKANAEEPPKASQASKAGASKPKEETAKMVFPRPRETARGHTGYLSFGKLGVVG